MNYIKSNKLSDIRSVTHGFICPEGSLNISDISRRVGFKKIKTINQIHSSDIIYLDDVNKYENSY